MELKIEELETRAAPLAICLIPPGDALAADAAQVPDCVTPHHADCHPVGPDLIVCAL
jgi:hypothetical protein